MAGLFEPFQAIEERQKLGASEISTISEGTGSSIVSANSYNLTSTDTITYIYDVADLVAFRDAVNAGNNYAGKTVCLMADIDLSSICSSELGSWTKIGTGETVFNGTFDGREKTISGIYINDTNLYTGIFRALGVKGIIKNLTVKGNITSGTNTGGIVAYNYGLVEKCTNYITMNHKGNDWIIGGIVGYNKGTISKCINYANVTGYDSIGGIAGINNGIIKECVNRGNIKNTCYSSGGIAGINGYNKSGMDAGWCGSGKIYSCYNTGTITGKNWAGGLIGAHGYNLSSAQSYIYDSYSIGTASIAGHTDYGTATNCYTKLVNYRVLSPYFLNDIHNQNNGYPILKWQTTQYNIVENQAYIKIGETLSLTLEMEGEYEDLNNVTWTSADETVATVDSSGKVTGKSVGRTVITFCNNNSGLKAKAVVNVYRNRAGAITVPQLEIGDRYTLILREDGTVWSVGINNVGQCR